MSWHEILASLGINPAVLAAGGFGGVLRALSRRHLKLREVFVSPVCGALAAAYLTLPVVHYLRAVGWPLPEDDSQAILASAFLLGTCAMWISDILFEALVRRFAPKQPQNDRSPRWLTPAGLFCVRISGVICRALWGKLWGRINSKR